MTVNIASPGRPCFCVTYLSTDNGTATPQPLPRRSDEIIAKIGGYWESTEARNLFAPSSPSGGMDIILSLRIGVLKGIINNPMCINNFVSNMKEDCELKTEEVIYYSQKATYLYYAYELALHHLPERNKTWAQCYEEIVVSSGPPTITLDNGPYGATHIIGSVQHMYFTETDEGPFYLSLEQREMQKYPRRTGEYKIRKKTGKKLLLLFCRANRELCKTL